MVGDGFDGLNLHAQAMFDEEVRVECAKRRAVVIENCQRVLRDRLKAPFLKTMEQAVFIDLFQMPVPKVAMQAESRFPDLVAQEVYFIFGIHFPDRALASTGCG